MWEFLVQRARFSFLIIISILVAGSLSVLAIPKEATPEVKVPYASVLTFYPGASPSDIESTVTEPLEERILNLEGLSSMSSNSSENISSIFVEFETDSDIKDRVRALQDTVNTVASQLPEGAESPIVNELNFSNQPIFTLALSADKSHGELVEIAEAVKSEILEVSSVSEVDLVGARPKQIQIEVDTDRLQQYGVSINEVFGALQSSEVTMPLGSVETNEKTYSVRMTANLEAEDIDDLIIRKVGDENITIAHIASVRYRSAEKTRYSRLSLDASEPQEALSLSVYKKTGGDILAMVDDINERLDEMKDSELEGVTIIRTLDSAEDIRQQLGDLSQSGLLTVALVFVILLFALGFKEAIIAGLSIPLTFMISFTGLVMVGETINFLSLFSLILALGILVDTGVVITEGMHVRMKEGLSSKEVALATVREYKWPLISGTMTTVAAFAPMLLMTGIIGEFIKHIPITVSITLLASLFVGLGLLPVIGARFLKNSGPKNPGVMERMIDGFKGIYKSILGFFLRRRWRQVFLLFAMAGAFASSLILPISGALEVVMFPQTDYRYFFIEVELPQGSLLEETQYTVEMIEEKLLSTPEIDSFISTVGGSANIAEGVGAMGVDSAHLANFTINLKEDRERDSLEIVEEYREAFEDYEGAEINVIGVSDGPPSASPVEFRIVGADLDLLQEYSDKAVEVLSEVEGAVNTSSSLNDSVKEYVFKVDRERAAMYGLNPMTLAQIARLTSGSMTVMQTEKDGEEVDVVLSTKGENRIGDILGMPIVTPAGTLRFSTFVQMSLEPAPTSIAHDDGERSVTIRSDIESDSNAALVLEDFKDTFDEEIFEDGYRIEYGGESEEMMESFASLGRAMLIGMMLIVVILILQFNSFRQAFIVLATIPLALIGVFVGLTLIQLPLSFPAFIGVVALVGIVVNNAIILIDRINKNIEEGYAQEDAILEAGTARFQPILLTSITTVAGILPLALSDPTWGPLGSSIISGLVFSTLLTLVVIPSSYHLFIRR